MLFQKHLFLGMSEGLSINLGLFPSRKVFFWPHPHLECFGEELLFEEVFTGSVILQIRKLKFREWVDSHPIASS